MLDQLKTRFHNLPGQLTPLIGRAREIQAVCSLLRQPAVRLVTLTGPGGVGKTRLSLQVATELIDEFADGICFVPLAPIRDPDLVTSTLAQALGLKETNEQPLRDLLKASLQNKRLLLLLDNFEQVLAAAPRLADLLADCPHLNILVTSRAVLHLRGEHEFPVPPLALPDFTHLPESEALAQYAAVALFLECTRAVKPGFELTPANSRAIAEICIRLDGLPLAIELAAARSKLLPPQALLARLRHRLHVLTSAARDVPLRQQTLRHALAWSYDLLDTQEQRLFRCLSVFVGGCTLEAVESLSMALGELPADVLDEVASLMDKSLLQQTGQEGEAPPLSLTLFLGGRRSKREKKEKYGQYFEDLPTRWLAYWSKQRAKRKLRSSYQAEDKIRRKEEDLNACIQSIMYSVASASQAIFHEAPWTSKPNLGAVCLGSHQSGKYRAATRGRSLISRK